MRNRAEWAVAAKAAVIVLVVMLGVPALMGAVIAWDTTFEGVPPNSQAVSQGALRIRDLKEQIRLRLSAETLFGNGTTDTGRLRPGAARAFVADAAPTAIGGVDTATLSTLDAGRLWVDTTNVATSGVQLKYYNSGWLPAAADSGAVPQYALILWDQATGCAGAANVCPCGFTEATEFRNLAVRGADIAAATTTIPDTVGTSCNGYTAAYGTGCNANHDGYTDTQTVNTLVGHTHTETTLGGGTAVQGGTTSANVSTPTGTTGNGDPWPGPFRTVLFCRKS